MEQKLNSENISNEEAILKDVPIPEPVLPPGGKVISIEENDSTPLIELDYVDPTPGEFPLLAFGLSHPGELELPEKLLDGDRARFIQLPPEPENPAEMDDRQNVLNVIACGCNILSPSHMPTDSEDSRWPKFSSLRTYIGDKLALQVHLWAILYGHDKDGTNVDLDGCLGNISKQGDQDGQNVLARVPLILQYDEPSLAQLIGSKVELPNNAQYSLQTGYKRLAQKLKDQSIQAMPYLNLLPIHGLTYKNAGDSIHPSKNYARYLQEYKERFKPAVYTFDCYPILQYSPLAMNQTKLLDMERLNGELVVVHERFYRTLEIISRHAKENGKKWWYYPLVIEHPSSDHYYPIQKEEYLRFSVFTALAYGAKGLEFWKFLQDIPVNEGEKINRDVENNINSFLSYYLRGPINADRTRGPVWFWVRKIIEEVRKFGDIFKNATIQNVYHTNWDQLKAYADLREKPKSGQSTKYGPVPKGFESLVTPDSAWGMDLVTSSVDEEGRLTTTLNIPFIDSIECRGINGGGIFTDNSVTATSQQGLGVVVSHFKSSGKLNDDGAQGSGASDYAEENEYVMLVSHDVEHYQQVTVKFHAGTVMQRLLLNRHGRLDNSRLISGKQTYILPPGGYLLFKKVN
ncbi:MAG: hypothetical protein K2N88_06295 [Muribaculaceae bacterium]|nr:hypothetical protein [Muribaculaceae bacterium]